MRGKRCSEEGISRSRVKNGRILHKPSDIYETNCSIYCYIGGVRFLLGGYLVVGRKKEGQAFALALEFMRGPEARTTDSGLRQ